ncbi:thioredoxin family protein [Companilactobacillus kimchiensis]|uniref:Thioredoxin domain-containing protein n=1 Tax=Companilactobacillus kimchiensis TaxID=993692 RepID=A0A0R2LIW2_9LACO|nr:thioredoxin family protein [Companilactobacillus kimchiensis]KRN98823.1 hypothetical protein IV57_GL000735 [Companilactobacillus kimchiensis]
MKILTEKNFDEVLAKPFAIVNFSTRFCRDAEKCAAQEEALQNMEDKLPKEVLIGSVDVDQNPYLAVKYEIKKLPTTLIFKDGEIADYLETMQGEEPLNNEEN